MIEIKFHKSLSLEMVQYFEENWANQIESIVHKGVKFIRRGIEGDKQRLQVFYNNLKLGEIYPKRVKLPDGCNYIPTLVFVNAVVRHCSIEDSLNEDDLNDVIDPYYDEELIITPDALYNLVYDSYKRLGFKII